MGRPAKPSVKQTTSKPKPKATAKRTAIKRSTKK